MVLGASPKPVRYSYMALKLLSEKGFPVIPVHPKAGRIEHLPVLRELSEVQGPVDTLTLYLAPDRVHGLIDAIVALRPGRVILNPGSECRALEQALHVAGIPFEHACTLVLLRTGQF